MFQNAVQGSYRFNPHPTVKLDERLRNMESIRNDGAGFNPHPAVRLDESDVKNERYWDTFGFNPHPVVKLDESRSTNN